MNTQDGYDWPTPHEKAPELPKAQPMAQYFREQLADEGYKENDLQSEMLDRTSADRSQFLSARNG